MLDKLRQFAKSKGAIILMGILILSFGLFWGISDMFGSRYDAQKLATVGDGYVDIASFQRALKMELDRRADEISRQTGKGVELSVLRDQLLAQGAGVMIVQQLAARLAYVQEASKMGIEPSQDYVVKMVQGITAFQDEEGQFSRDRFVSALRGSGLTEAELIRGFKEDMAQSGILGSVTSSAFLSKELAQALYAYEGERRMGSWFFLTPDLVSDEMLPQMTPQDIEKYYKTHQEKFSVPERRHLKALILSLAQLKAGRHVSSEEVREEFSRRKGSLGTSELRAFSHLLVKEESQAIQARDWWLKGKTPSYILTQLGGAIFEKEGLPVARAALPKKIADVVFSMKAGELSAPVKTANGFYIFRLESVQAAKHALFEEVSGRLKDELLTAKAKEALYDLVKNVEDEVSGGATFEEISKKHQVAIIDIPSVDIQGKGLSEGVKRLPREDLQKILSAGFETADGMESSTLDLSSGDITIVRVEKVTPSVVLSFEEAKTQVAEALAYENRLKFLTDVAQKIFADKLGDQGKKLLSLGALPGVLALKRNGDLDLSSVQGGRGALLRKILASNQGFSIQTVDKIFDTPKGKNAVVPLPYFTPQGQPAVAIIVGRMGDLFRSSMDGFEASRKVIQEGGRQGLASDILAFYTLALHEKFKTKLNPAVLNGMRQKTSLEE